MVRNSLIINAPTVSITDELVGKNWHEPKKAFRPTAGQTSYEKRKEQEKIAQVAKAREQEMKDEKEAERNRRVQAIKDRRKAKEEKERYEKMAEKMHKKLVERRKRREKRNKLLKS
jgi:rRNA-processing protein CGR1